MISLLSHFETLGQNALAIPPLLSGPDFELTLGAGETVFYENIETATYGVNGPLLGPTLFFEKGDNVSIDVLNNLAEATTIHWHGLHIPAAMDGGPHTVIEAGATWPVSFEVMDHASTFWYHPHLHEHTNEHVYKGIAGMIIVSDELESALDLPQTYGVDDIPVVIQTRAFDSEMQFDVLSKMDTSVLCNGTVFAEHTFPAQVVRLRCLNGASQRAFNLSLSNSQSFYQIAGDGSLLNAPVEMTTLLLAPGERAEILVDLTGMEGQSLQLINHGTTIPNNIYGAESVTMGPSSIAGYDDNPLNGSDFNILQFNVEDPTENAVENIPAVLVAVEPIPESDSDIGRSLTFSPEVMGPVGMVNGPFVINGSAFDMDVVNYEIPLGNTEIWTLFNQSGVAHPFHIHDVQFQILDRNGAAPPANEQGWKDVVLVKSMETVRFITRFEDFADEEVPYMYHCHMLEHEDEGMMGQFTVVDVAGQVEENSNSNVIIYPNPGVNGLFNIELMPPRAFRMEVYSTTGTLVFSHQFPNGLRHQSQLESAAGLYFVKVIYGDNAFDIVKFQIE